MSEYSLAVKLAANAAVAAAIRDGRLERRWDCERCGAVSLDRATMKIDAHHEDYSRPLDVVWLCRKCHGLRHGEIKRGGGLAKEVRTTFVLPTDLAKLVDDYWHSVQLRSRPDAIRELLRAAFDTGVAASMVELHAQPAKEQRHG